MHTSVLDWFRQELHNTDVAGARVLDVGSFDVNGTVKPLFANVTEYVGVDMRDGPGVDRVMRAAELDFPDSTFDFVVSTEMLEHDATPWKSVAEMHRVLKPGGTVFITARGYDTTGCFGVHDYPGDYYRFSVEGARVLLEDAGFEVSVCVRDTDPASPGFFARGAKPCT